jgi:hypothetical protein
MDEFLGLYRTEIDTTALVPAAQRVLSEIREGRGEREAIAAAGVSKGDYARWKRDPGFRAALREARTRKPFELPDVRAIEERMLMHGTLGVPSEAECMPGVKPVPQEAK